MHICIIQTVLDPFKGANHLPLLAACKDTTFTIVCNRSKVEPKDLPPNIHVVTVPGRTGSYYYGSGDFRLGQLVMKKYPAESDFWKQFDVIHLNQVMGPALRNLKKTGVPLLFLIHHPVTADLEVAVAESSFFSKLLWHAKYHLLQKWQKAMCSAADQIVTVSQTMQERIAADYSVDPAKISIVPNGVDGDIFTPITDAECEYDVIAVGSFVHPRKGFRYLIEVYKKLAAKGYTITDVGRRSEDQMRQLKKIEGVTVHSTVDSAQLTHLMRHSRVLVSTSLFEGFGLSLIEALACGHPAYAFSVGAVPEVLGSFDVNLLSPTRDTDAMVESVDEFLLLPPAEREGRGANFRRNVLQKYSLGLSAMALEKIYEGMSNHRG